MRNRIVLIILIIGIAFTLVPAQVYAANSDTVKCEDTLLGSTQFQNNRCSGRGQQCVKRFQDPAYYLQTALNIMKYLGIGFFIFFFFWDFFKVMISDNKN